MARASKKKAEPGAGHNSGEVTEQEAAALQLWFSTKIRAARKAADAAKAIYDSKREDVNGLFSQARGELKMTRKEFEEVLALQDMTEAEFLNHEAKRTGRMRLQGLPVGEQIELPLGDTADDLARARADGFRAGMRGDDGIPPEHVSPVCHQDWLAGWGDGQEKLMEGLTLGESLIEARKAKAVELEAEPEEEPEPEDIEDGLDDEARRLKRAGWADKPTAEEVAFADADVVEEMA